MAAGACQLRPALEPTVDLEPIGNLEPEGATVLRDLVLKMEPAGRIEISCVEKVIDTRRGFQVFYQVLAEQREVHDRIAGGIASGDGAAGKIGEHGVAAARVLDL